MGHDGLDDYCMYEALAEILNVDSEVIDLICPYYDQNTGSSGEGLYEWYFEIPIFVNLEVGIQRRVKKLLNKSFETFPFGETLYYDEGQLGGTIADPFGWRREYEEEDYFRKLNLPKEQVLKELTDIRSLIFSSDNDLITKSLAFSSFSLTESFVRSYIWRGLDTIIDRVQDDRLKEYFLNHFKERLNNDNGRKVVYEYFSHRKLISIPGYKTFRHSLAHNIGEGSVNDGKLTVKDKNGKAQTSRLNIIIDDLITYVNGFD